MTYTTKQLFIDSVTVDPMVDAILNDVLDETQADWEKGYLSVLVTTAEGNKDFRRVWYLSNKVTGETSHQNVNTLANPNVVQEANRQALTDYLIATFNGHFTGRIDLVNFWVEADVFTASGGTATMKKVIVFKNGTNPISHLDIV